jgi:hypothetical protein
MQIGEMHPGVRKGLPGVFGNFARRNVACEDQASACAVRRNQTASSSWSARRITCMMFGGLWTSLPIATVGTSDVFRHQPSLVSALGVRRSPSNQPHQLLQVKFVPLTGQRR